MVPDSLGTLQKIDWIPIDSLAAILIELALCKNSDRKVYHIINPKLIIWISLLPSVYEELGLDVKIVLLAA